MLSTSPPEKRYKQLHYIWTYNYSFRFIISNTAIVSRYFSSYCSIGALQQSYNIFVHTLLTGACCRVGISQTAAYRYIYIYIYVIYYNRTCAPDVLESEPLWREKNPCLGCLNHIFVIPPRSYIILHMIIWIYIYAIDRETGRWLCIIVCMYTRSMPIAYT